MFTTDGAMTTTMGMTGKSGGKTEIEKVLVLFQEPQELELVISDEHFARIEIKLESKVTMPPACSTAFFPNFTNKEREFSQVHRTSTFITPSNINIFEQAKLWDKPPLSVGESKRIFNPEASSLNETLESCGVGGSVVEEITVNNIFPDDTTVYSLCEGPLNSTNIEYVPVLNPNKDIERDKLESDLPVEEKDSEGGKKGWEVVVDPSSTFVNENETSTRDEGEKSNVTNNKSIHSRFSTTDKVDSDTEIVLQHEVVKVLESEIIVEKDVHEKLEAEDETQYNL